MSRKLEDYTTESLFETLKKEIDFLPDDEAKEGFIYYALVYLALG